VVSGLDRLAHRFWACISCVYLIGVYLTGMHLMGVHLTGVHLTGVYLISGHLFPPCVAAVDDAMGPGVCAGGFCNGDGGRAEEVVRDLEAAY
jgi:hypothetical protein